MSGTRLDLQRRTASAVAELCLRHTRELNALLIDIERRDRGVDLETAKTMIARIMAETYVAALYPIFEEYPDLKPIGYP